MPAPSASPTFADIERAAAAGAGVVRRTPVLTSRTLGERSGGTVVLKAENLQKTGSFKPRGVTAKLAALGDEGCVRGVVAASAGNHAQAVAYAARERGVPCEVFIPATAPVTKANASEALGATVHLGGESLEECFTAALERAEQGAAYIHPYDDAQIVAGQATLGLELLDQVEDLAKVIVPLGGGGLASGVALAVKSARPEVHVAAVQVEACAPFAESLRAGEPVPAAGALTIADGIAVKRPGDLTLPLVERWVDELAVVGEDDVGEAMVLLLERAKLLVEGAGAVGVAALLTGRVTPADTGTTVVVLSGGNVDPGLLAQVVRRHESEEGRRLVLLTRVSDRPGSMAALLQVVGRAGANLIEVSHVRDGMPLHVRETGVELVLETRGRTHARRVEETLAAEGYPSRRLTT